MAVSDLAVLTQDPDIVGGLRSQAEAFWRAAAAVGRTPQLFYVSRDRATSLVRPSLDIGFEAVSHDGIEGIEVPAVLPELDFANQVLAGARLARRLREARSLWVVATSAPYGYAALRSRRRYACWIGTGLEVEWESRRRSLPPARRAALRLNARPLLSLQRRVLQGASHVYATSPAAKAAIVAEADLNAAEIGILPIPVDVHHFSPTPGGGAARERPTMIFVGRAADPRKNVRILGEVLRLVRAQLPEARLQLIGEPPVPEDRAALAGVEILGEIDSIGPLLRDASLFVLPSLQEGFGIVVAEALAAGVPAVITPCGGPETLVRASGGGLVASDFSPEALAEAALELLTDEPRRLDAAEAGRSYVVREHSIERFQALLAEALREVDQD